MKKKRDVNFMNNLNNDYLVSVIIPTYNGGG